MLDARGIPTIECPECQSNIFIIKAVFDEDYELCLYMLDGECAECGSFITVPTPLDLPGVNNE